MAGVVEAVGLSLGTLGLLMLGVTLRHAEWRVSSVHGNVITTSTIFENLWFSCATDSTGVYNCWEFPSMLALSGYIQACRALMVTALLLGFLALLFGIVGLRCTHVAHHNPRLKANMAAGAGAMDVLAGLCGMVAVSWYAFNITKDFFDPLYPGTKYELGPALYLGWAASILCILGGLSLFSQRCTYSDDDVPPSNPPPYKAPQSILTRGRSDSDDNSGLAKYGKNAYV
ncbi:claudin-15 [Tachyglossus aculeatus]|uniref:claudin-15 n=1 Tax=Tachyglossus aculeatus TaxID=9261 RepID=UPI0018F53CCE|nr:claudin-15 [Tachyglossus aculeatus]